MRLVTIVVKFSCIDVETIRLAYRCINIHVQVPA